MTIEEIKQKLTDIHTPDDPFLQKIKEDHRVGVRNLYTRWHKEFSRKKEQKREFYKLRKYEESLWEKGYDFIGGIDEVGRGPLAGPVVASCVILSPQFFLPGLIDSKKISEQKREKFFSRIIEEAVAVGIGMATAEEIDRLNIYEATKLAMYRAISDLPIKPNYLLIDAMTLENEIPQQSIIKGDLKSISIAASSIVAKVTRDTYMKKLAEKYPQYGFENHKGYGTREHIRAIEKYGPMKEHRKTFVPTVKPLTLF